ncbi:septum formation initiator [Streptomyces dioscori]|uniref:Septum formation initiator n=1 Tax=Streptomyces dioscori TaxID=2109333 RepID=A0A2P8Q8E2_9ACTN|nr:septum formation initiator [Streptomyces dioscori]PSM42508.1 septum formation initiator [Streptomyces dioscori]
MPSRTFLALAGWTAAAVAATLTGLAAVEIIGDGITGSSDGGTLSSEQVEQQLDAASATSPSGPGGGPATATPSATPDTGASTPTSSSTPTAAAGSGTGGGKTLSTPGGTAIAVCEGATVRLLSWAPAQGYGVKSADPGPDDEHAEVKFEGTAGKVELRARCTDGRPTGSWKQDD